MIALATGMALAGLAEGMMDKIQFRLPNRWIGNRFWDPAISWMNKWDFWEEGKERFLGSSTAFVFLTDGWHLMKWIRNRGIDLALWGAGVPLLWVLALRVMYGICFEISFRKYD
jgi:hypothetical protein